MEHQVGKLQASGGVIDKIRTNPARSPYNHNPNRRSFGRQLLGCLERPQRRAGVEKLSPEPLVWGLVALCAVGLVLGRRGSRSAEHR